jgi:hypothetical protein
MCSEPVYALYDSRNDDLLTMSTERKVTKRSFPRYIAQSIRYLRLKKERRCRICQTPRPTKEIMMNQANF